jgi:putative nucleotidyltransferase with HDIG domain
MNSYVEVFESLERGQVDAGVTNKDFGNEYQSQFDVERTPFVFRPSRIAFAFTSDSSSTPYFVERIDYHIKELKADSDSIYYQSMEEHLGVEAAEETVVPDWVKWLLVGTVGLALLLLGGNLVLRARVRSKTRELRQDIAERKRAQEQLERSFINLAETNSRAMSARDPYTARHQERVADLVCLVGQEMGLDEDRLQCLRLGALLHDIGKIAIPEVILAKPGKLPEEEWDLVRTHTSQGYEILKDTGLPGIVAEMALHHHERLDGSGYPDGLRGDELSPDLRILIVCNVVEAMSAFRPYRRARSMADVLEELGEGRGTKYDAQVVDIVRRLIEAGQFKPGEGQ